MEYLNFINKSNDIKKLNQEFKSIDRMIGYDNEKNYKKSIILQRIIILEKFEAILASEKEINKK